MPVALHTGNFLGEPLFLAMSISPLSLLLSLLYNLKYKVMGVGGVALPRHKKALKSRVTPSGVLRMGCRLPFTAFVDITCSVTRHQWGQISACVDDTSFFNDYFSIIPLYLLIIEVCLI